MNEGEVDVRAFVKDGIEAILGSLTLEGVSDPYAIAAPIVAKKHSITPETFKWVHHPFHWYLVQEKGLVVMDLSNVRDPEHKTCTGVYIYRPKLMSAISLELLAQEMFAKHGTYIAAKLRAIKEGKYGPV